MIPEILLVLSSLVLGLLPETLKLDVVSKSNSPSERRPAFLDYSAYKPLITDRRIVVILMMSFLSQFRYILLIILTPYTSVRFKWPISEVSLDLVCFGKHREA